MNHIKWLLYMLFSPNKTEQEKLEWNWFIKIDLPERYRNLFFVRLFNNGMKRERTIFKLDSETDDEVPF